MEDERDQQTEQRRLQNQHGERPSITHQRAEVPTGQHAELEPERPAHGRACGRSRGRPDRSRRCAHRPACCLDIGCRRRGAIRVSRLFLGHGRDVRPRSRRVAAVGGLTVLKDDDLVAQVQTGGRMSGHQHRAVIAGQAPEELHQPALEDLVQSAGRLVEQ